MAVTACYRVGHMSRTLKVIGLIAIGAAATGLSTGYFLFAKVNKEGGFAAGKLSFDLALEPLEGDTSWIEGAITKASELLKASIPASNPECIYCKFAQSNNS